MGRVTDLQAPGQAQQIAKANQVDQQQRAKQAAPAAGAPENVGWLKGGPQVQRVQTPRLSPPRIAPHEPLAPLGAVGAVGAAQALKPTDVLRVVKNGDLTIDIPVKPMELFDGRVSADKDTVVRMALSVRDGKIDFSKSKIRFEPEVTAFGVNMPGAELTKDGRLAFQLDWLPDLVLGEAAPAKLADFVEQMSSGKAMPFRVLGIQVGEVGGDDDDKKKPAPDAAAAPKAEKAPKPDKPSNWSRFSEKVDVANTRLSMTNVQFMDGAVPLGESGTVRLTPDSKLRLDGSLTDLELSGRVGVSELKLDGGGIRLAGGRGTADLSVSWKAQPGSLSGSVDAAITNLSLTAESAVARRENGDFLDLAKGKLEGAEVRFKQRITDGKPEGAPEPSLHIQRFEGMINGGQVSIPDGNGVAQIILGKSSVKGSVSVSPSRIALAGDVDLNARVTGLDVRGNLALNVSQLDLSGKGQVQYDSNRGLTVDGPIRAAATISGSQTIDGAKGSIGKSKLEVTTNQVQVGVGGQLSLKGEATVDVQLNDANVGGKGMALKGGQGSLKGKAHVSVDREGVVLSRASLDLSAALEDGSVSLGDSLKLDIAKGTSLEAAVSAATFGAKTTLDLRKAKVSAELDAGKVKLPNGQQLDFKPGTKLELKLDRLRFPESGTPDAQGSLELLANLGAGKLDGKWLSALNGVSVSQVEGLEQVFRLRVGRFSIAESGSFELQDLGFGIEAQVRKLSGQIR